MSVPSSKKRALREEDVQWHDTNGPVYNTRSSRHNRAQPTFAHTAEYEKAPAPRSAYYRVPENDEFLSAIYTQQIEDAQKLIDTARAEIRRIHAKYPGFYEHGSPVAEMVESLTHTPALIIDEQLQTIRVAKAKLQA
jgi:hypothetical protein